MKIINLVHSRLNLNGNVFHIDNVVHKMVRFLSPLKSMMKIQHMNNIFSKNLMKFHNNVPYFYVILTYHVRNEKPYIKNMLCVYMCSYGRILLTWLCILPFSSINKWIYCKSMHGIKCYSYNGTLHKSSKNIFSEIRYWC